MEHEQTHTTIPRAPKPACRGLRRPNRPTLESPYRKYDAPVDGLRNVLKIAPALLSDDGVTIDEVTDGHHLLVAVTTIAGDEGHILVRDRGWMPLSTLDPYEEVGERTNKRGWTVNFTYSTVAGATMRCLRLSTGDKRKIVAAILKHYMGAMSAEQLQRARRRHF